MMNATLSKIDDIGANLSGKITKAKALCGEVLTHYCEFAKADPYSTDEQERENARELCSYYPTWSVLLYCLFDMLMEAEKLTDELGKTVFERG